MKKFKVTFWLNGKWINTVITANGHSQARAMIADLYPGANTITLTEIAS